jgi:hypothetical protein
MNLSSQREETLVLTIAEYQNTQGVVVPAEEEEV